VTGGWRKFHNEQLHGLCCSSNIIRVFKLRRMRRVGHVGCMWEGDWHVGCMWEGDWHVGCMWEGDWHVGCMWEGDWHAGFWWRKRPHSRWEGNTEMKLIGQDVMV